MTDPRDEIIKRLANECVRLKAKIKDLEGVSYPDIYTWMEAPVVYPTSSHKMIFTTFETNGSTMATYI